MKVDLIPDSCLYKPGMAKFKPTITDLKLLIGTREWKEVMRVEKINENTIDPNDDGSQQGIKLDSSGKQIEQQSLGSSSGRDSRSPLF